MPIHDFSSQRLFVDASLGPGQTIELERAQANYLISVLRMKGGDQVLVFNGRDGEWLSELDITGRKAGRLTCKERKRSQPDQPTLELCFAPLKQGRLDYLVQKAVEMGCGRLTPVITQRTQVTKLNADRIRANIIEAAEQCSILTIPYFTEPIRFDRLSGHLEDDRMLVFADEAASEANPIEALKALRGKKISVLIGPEGGFSDHERDTILAMQHSIAINLGPRILRADTAAVAALAVVQAACGDW